MKTSKREIIDITKAWVAISLAFGIVLYLYGHFDLPFYLTFLLSAITVGIGFVFHELAHKLVAQRYGFFSEFRAFNYMLILAIALSFTGFVLAAPGAVFISGQSYDKNKNGKISLAGPLMNLIIAAIFLVIFYFSGGFLNMLSFFGFQINTWLALFNMVPFGMFDGKKILRWNKLVYIVFVIVVMVFFIIGLI